MSSVGAALCAAPISNDRAEASRKNGAKSRGPKTPDGTARSAENALKHGFRAQEYVVLPDADAAAFQELEAACCPIAWRESGVGAGCAVRRADGFPGSHGPPNTLSA